MRDEKNGVRLAVPFAVPLIADAVVGSRLTYGTRPIRPVDDVRRLDVLLFSMENDSIGRVTFRAFAPWHSLWP